MSHGIHSPLFNIEFYLQGDLSGKGCMNKNNDRENLLVEFGFCTLKSLLSQDFATWNNMKRWL